jgi:hypothetical protein
MRLLFAIVLACTPTVALAAPVAKPSTSDSSPRQPAARPAQDPKERVIYKKRTIIDFTGALIEGDLMKPEGSYVVSRKVSRFSTLIRLRENYLPELIASPNEL